MVKKKVTVSGDVPAALMSAPEAAALMESLDGVVYTTPCRDLVAKHAPRSLVTQELIYEPVPDDLARLKEELLT